MQIHERFAERKKHPKKAGSGHLCRSGNNCRQDNSAKAKNDQCGTNNYAYKFAAFVIGRIVIGNTIRYLAGTEPSHQDNFRDIPHPIKYHK